MQDEKIAQKLIDFCVDETDVAEDDDKKIMDAFLANDENAHQHYTHEIKSQTKTLQKRSMSSQ